MIYVFRYEKRPWTLNSERAGGKAGRGQGGHHGRAKLTREWRAEFARLAAPYVTNVEQLAEVVITVRQFTRNNVMPDTGACVCAAKAAIDGLVDAGLLPGDGPKVVLRLVFDAPRNVGVDALELMVEAA